jgi:hypothetical protein
LKSLFTGEPYPGRVLQYDNALSDRLGLLLGVGLSHPKDEFVAGLTLELMTGVNLFIGKHWAKIDKLDGVAVGSTFSSSAALPKQTRWEQDISFGLALDLRYVTTLFDRK